MRIIGRKPTPIYVDTKGAEDFRVRGDMIHHSCILLSASHSQDVMREHIILAVSPPVATYKSAETKKHQNAHNQVSHLKCCWT